MLTACVKLPKGDLKKRKGKRNQQPACEPHFKVKKADTSGKERKETDLLWKATSADDAVSVHIAEVYDPKCSSMPPDSVPHFISVAQFLPSPTFPNSPLPPVLDITFDEDWQRLHENRASLHKLQVNFAFVLSKQSNCCISLLCRRCWVQSLLT